jgi:hypothetical protein
MRVSFLTAVLAALVAGCESPRHRCNYFTESGECAVYPVSLVELIANPDWYHGKRVQVVGFVHFEFEGDSIWLHREDYEQMLTSNAVWLSAAPEQERSFGNSRYGLVEGTFNAKRHGHGGLFSGAIELITRLEPAPSREEIDRLLEHAPAEGTPRH